VPRAYCWVYGLHGCDAPGEWLPFFMNSPWGRVIHWGHFALQTAFAVIAAAVIVNLFPRRPRK